MASPLQPNIFFILYFQTPSCAHFIAPSPPPNILLFLLFAVAVSGDKVTPHTFVVAVVGDVVSSPFDVSLVGPSPFIYHVVGDIYFLSLVLVLELLLDGIYFLLLVMLLLHLSW